MCQVEMWWTVWPVCTYLHQQGIFHFCPLNWAFCPWWVWSRILFCWLLSGCCVCLWHKGYMPCDILYCFRCWCIWTWLQCWCPRRSNHWLEGWFWNVRIQRLGSTHQLFFFLSCLIRWLWQISYKPADGEKLCVGVCVGDLPVGTVPYWFVRVPADQKSRKVVVTPSSIPCRTWCLYAWD